MKIINPVLILSSWINRNSYYYVFPSGQINRVFIPFLNKTNIDILDKKY